MNDEQALDTVLHSLDRYRIDEKKVTLTKTVLGRGAFGVVVLGEIGRSFWKRKKGTWVAVKQLQANGTLAENRKLALALVQELHVWAGLAHPNILRLDGFFLEDRLDRAWLISPYMKNGNIRSYLDEHNPGMIVRFRMSGEIASGVAYLHQRNICHGDIKSANVLVDGNGQAKLCDFGLTKVMENGTTGLSSTEPKGTTRYMAPELFHNAARTKKNDVWAWSCLGLEILFNRIPYGDANGNMAIMTRIVQGVPPLDLDSINVDLSIKRLFKACWVAEPQKRVNIKACLSAIEGVINQLMKHQASVNADELHRTDIARHTSDYLKASPRLRVDDTNEGGVIPTASGIPATERGARPAVKVLPVVTSDDDGALSIMLAGDLAKDNTDSIPPSSLDVQMGIMGLRADAASNDAPGRADPLQRTIERHRQTLFLRPEGHPKRHEALQNLGVSLLNKYREDSNVAHLDEAITIFRQTLLLRPEGQSNRHQTLQSLGSSLMDKYGENGDVAQLEEAIDLLRQTLSLRPMGHSERHHTLQHLANSLLDKYRKTGDVADLDEAIELYDQTLLLRPEGHSERHYTFQSLASSLLDKYHKQGNVARLDNAVDLYRQALLLRPEGHSERHEIIQDLATTLLEKYRENGDVAHLDEAIDLYQQALFLRPEGHSTRHNTLQSLGASLLDRYINNKDVTQLDNAIDFYRQTLPLRPEGHYDRHQTLHGLALSLTKKYLESGDVAHRDEAIGLHHRTLLLRPEGHPDRQITLSSLSFLLLKTYREDGDVTHLDEAIGLFRQLLLLRPEGHPDRHVALTGLGSSLLEKYQENKVAAYLDESIDLSRQALLHRPEGHPKRHLTLKTLTASLLDQYDEDGDVTHLDEVVDLLRPALDQLSIGHSQRPSIRQLFDRALGMRSSAIIKSSLHEEGELLEKAW